jgi:uncharacterized protein (DUF4415 family)
MKRRGDTGRYTAEEIDEMLAGGESQTDWAAVKAITEDGLEASIAADPDDVHEPIDWSLAVEGIPPRKGDIHIRIDEDVLDWFRQAGRGYQTRINNVLRAFTGSRKRAARQRAFAALTIWAPATRYSSSSETAPCQQQMARRVADRLAAGFGDDRGLAQ